MNKGDLIVYFDSSGTEVDYGIVTNHLYDTLWWACWSKEKRAFTFDILSHRYINVGPSVLGKW